MFCLMYWSFFWTVIIYTGSSFIFSYIKFPVVFLFSLCPRWRYRRSNRKIKGKFSSFWHQRKKHKHGRNCWRTKGKLLSKLLWHKCLYLLILRDFSRRFIHSGGFSYPSMHTWLRIPPCGDLNFELDKVCGISDSFTT